MKTKLMALAPLAFAALMLFGCTARDTDDSEKESGKDTDVSTTAQALTDSYGEAAETEGTHATTIIYVEGDGTTGTIVLTLTDPPEVTTTAGKDNPQAPETTTRSGETGSTAETTSVSSDNTPAETDATIRLSDIHVPSFGTVFASLEIPSIGVKNDVYFGDDNISLKNGLGMYTGSSLPGRGKSTLIAGHNTEKMLNKLGDAKIGDKIIMKTTYGTYVYEITSAQIASNKDMTAVETPGGDYLVLYTCYPFSSIWTEQRYFVQAKKISGPIVVG